MDSSPQSTSSISDEFTTSLPVGQEGSVEEEESHVHLPNPSYWPILLSVAIAITVSGLLFIPSFPWLSIVALPFVLVGILGWGLEDPMVPLQDKFVPVYHALDTGKF